MAVLVKWNLNLFVNDGKPLTLDGSINGITAYDKLSIKVPKQSSGSATGTTVDLQPSAVENIGLLLIKSDVYQAADGSNKLAYSFGNEPPAEESAETEETETPSETEETGAIDEPEENELLGPHVLIGNALVRLLGDDLTKITFINTTAKEANIEIIVGRKA